MIETDFCHFWLFLTSHLQLLFYYI